MTCFRRFKGSSESSRVSGSSCGLDSSSASLGDSRRPSRVSDVAGSSGEGDAIAAADIGLRNNIERAGVDAASKIAVDGRVNDLEGRCLKDERLFVCDMSTQVKIGSGLSAKGADGMSRSRKNAGTTWEVTEDGGWLSADCD